LRRRDSPLRIHHPQRFTANAAGGDSRTTAGLARMIERAADAAGLELKAHPHMLRHACGHAPANRGHDSQRSITSIAVSFATSSPRIS
jgi:site-specific recombinase XerD